MILKIYERHEKKKSFFNRSGLGCQNILRFCNFCTIITTLPHNLYMSPIFQFNIPKSFLTPPCFIILTMSQTKIYEIGKILFSYFSNWHCKYEFCMPWGDGVVWFNPIKTTKSSITLRKTEENSVILVWDLRHFCQIWRSNHILIGTCERFQHF